MRGTKSLLVRSFSNPNSLSILKVGLVSHSISHSLQSVSYVQPFMGRPCTNHFAKESPPRLPKTGPGKPLALPA